jgi:phospholipase C
MSNNYLYRLVGRALVLIGLLSQLPSAKGQATSSIPIKHFIFIIQENHSFDNYFGTFPGANGIPVGTALANYPGGPLVNKPFLLPQHNIPNDLPHSWKPARVDYDNGRMDGFFWGEYVNGYGYYSQGIPVPARNPALVTITKSKPAANATPPAPGGVNGQQVVSPHGFIDDEDKDAPDVEEQNEALASAAPSPSPSPDWHKRPSWVKYTLSYVDSSVIPNYWEYAQKYTLCDAFFSSLTGASQPNHLYTVSGQSGGLVGNYPATETCIYHFESIMDLFGHAGLTWSYYVDGTNPNPQQEFIWNPLPGFDTYINNPSLAANLKPTSQFYKDLSSGTLAQVSWLIPTTAESEHPPQDITVGMKYVTNLINAVMQSSYWQNCAIILMWDDYGGFYDHVPPVQTDEYGFGFRVPAIVISPYSISGAVIHTQYDLTSPLKLVETAFGLVSLSQRDGQSNNMLECFDFSQAPLPPDIITANTKFDFSKLASKRK